MNTSTKQKIQNNISNILQNKDNQSKYQEFIQHNPNAPKQIQYLKDQSQKELYQDFMDFLFIASKSNQILNKQIQEQYFQLYLTIGFQKAYQYLANLSNFQPDFQKETSVSVNVIKAINNDNQSTDASESDEEDTIPITRLQSSKKVQQLQKELVNKKLYQQDEIDGVYGEKTEQAIVQIQKTEKIEEEGVVGPKTWDYLVNPKVYQQKQKQRPRQLGGVDLQIDAKKLPIISGISIDQNTNQIEFLESSSKQSGIEVTDLATALTVFYNPDIKNKAICFSLDPFEETNPDGPLLRKILIPDIYEGKPFLSGTHISDILFEADYLLKKISFGVNEDSKTPFPIPEFAQRQGLKTLQGYIDETPQIEENKQWSRLWYVCKNIDVNQKDGILKIGDIQIEVQAKIMEINSQGKLVDKVVQDGNDSCFKFASTFTKLFDQLADYYPILKRMKQVYKAVGLARWMYLNRVPVDLKIVNEITNQLRNRQYTEQANTIQNFNIETSEKKKQVEVDIRTVAIRSLQKGDHETSEKNIEYAIQKLQEQEPGKKYYDTQIVHQQRKRGVLGGVDLNFDIMEKKNTQTQQQQYKPSKQPVKYNKKFSSNISQSSITTLQDDISTQMSDLEIGNEHKVPYVFKPNLQCVKCQNDIGMIELKYPVEQKYYCQLHHPFSCFVCKTIVEKSPLQIQANTKFYSSPYFSSGKQYFHQNCMKKFQVTQEDKQIWEQQKQFIQQVQTQVQQHLDKIKKGLKVAQLKLDKPAKFVCQICKSIQNTTDPLCQRCNKIDEQTLNIAVQNYMSKQQQQ